MVVTVWFAALAGAGDPPPDPDAPKPIVKVVHEIQVIPSTVEGPVRLSMPNRDGDYVYIDGWRAGVLPLQTELAEGPHLFRVEGTGGKHEVSIYVTLTKNLPKGQVTEVDLSTTIAQPQQP